jgi:hypothetical protein
MPSYPAPETIDLILDFRSAFESVEFLGQTTDLDLDGLRSRLTATAEMVRELSRQPCRPAPPIPIPSTN